MYLLLSFALLGSALGLPLNEVATTNEDLIARYVLPGESYPTFYDVVLFLDPENDAYFTGTVSIRIIANIQTNVLVLHAMEMEIQEIAVTNERNDEDIFASYTLATDDTHLLTINLNQTINPLESHIVTILYTGHYAENMFGIYVSTYVENGETQNTNKNRLIGNFAKKDQMLCRILNYTHHKKFAITGDIS